MNTDSSNICTCLVYMIYDCNSNWPPQFVFIWNFQQSFLVQHRLYYHIKVGGFNIKAVPGTVNALWNMHVYIRNVKYNKKKKIIFKWLKGGGDWWSNDDDGDDDDGGEKQDIQIKLPQQQ